MLLPEAQRDSTDNSGDILETSMLCTITKALSLFVISYLMKVKIFTKQIINEVLLVKGV